MMKNTTFFVAPLALLLLCACNQQSSSSPVPQAPAATDATEGDSMPAFVGRVWVSVTPGHPRGSILVFLGNKSMLKDSCFETFRVSEWGIISDTRIRWREDTIPIEAEYSQPTAENYVSISVPYVCPDMPR
jgi:hypothetical protein